MEIFDEVMTNQDSEEGSRQEPPSAKEMDRRMDYARSFARLLDVSSDDVFTLSAKLIASSYFE